MIKSASFSFYHVFFHHSVLKYKQFSLRPLENQETNLSLSHPQADESQVSRPELSKMTWRFILDTKNGSLTKKKERKKENNTDTSSIL